MAGAAVGWGIFGGGFGFGVLWFSFGAGVVRARRGAGEMGKYFLSEIFLGQTANAIVGISYDRIFVILVKLFPVFAVCFVLYCLIIFLKDVKFDRISLSYNRNCC